MNFLLIPKQGKPRFHTGDPFRYIERLGMMPVQDYLNRFLENPSIMDNFLPSIGVFNGDGEECFCYIVYNTDGVNLYKETQHDVNRVASNFFNAYHSRYVGNFVEIKSDVILVKTRGMKELLEMSDKDKRKIRKMLTEAEWVEHYYDRIGTE